MYNRKYLPLQFKTSIKSSNAKWLRYNGATEFCSFAKLFITPIADIDQLPGNKQKFRAAREGLHGFARNYMTIIYVIEHNKRSEVLIALFHSILNCIYFSDYNLHFNIYEEARN